MSNQLEKIYENILSKNLNPEDLILGCYDVLKKTKLELGGGNCGNVSVAICEFLYSKFNIKGLQIGVLTENIPDSTSEEEFLNNAPEYDIHHMYIILNDNMYDEMGKIDTQYLLDLSLDQYGEYNPIQYVFDYPEELNKIKKVLFGTNRTVSIEHFSSILQKNI